MQIIFGDHVDKVKDRFTVLELDTFIVENSAERITAWCVVETVPVEEMFMLENLQKLHSDLIAQYRARNWKYCIDALDHLQGKWNGELDTFYADLRTRIEKFGVEPPDSTWKPELVKSL